MIILKHERGINSMPIKQKLHLDYNTIAEKLKLMMPNLYSQGFEGIVICLSGGCMAGMHLVQVMNLPYSFITYNPFTSQPIWLSASLNTQRILVVTETAGTEALLTKNMLENAGHQPYFLSMYKDENSLFNPEFCLVDNTGLFQDVILPWDNSFDYKESVSVNMLAEEGVIEIKQGTETPLKERKNPEDVYIKDKTYWFLSDKTFNHRIIAPDDDYTITDLKDNTLTRQDILVQVGKVHKEGYLHIVVEDQILAVVLSSTYSKASIYLYTSNKLIKINASIAKSQVEYHKYLVEEKKNEGSTPYEEIENTVTPTVEEKKVKRRGLFFGNK